MPVLEESSQLNSSRLWQMPDDQVRGHCKEEPSSQASRSPFGQQIGDNARRHLSLLSHDRLQYVSTGMFPIADLLYTARKSTAVNKTSW